MEELTPHVLRLIRQEVAPLHAKIELLQAEVDRLERVVANLQKRIEDIELEHDDDPDEVINNVEEANLDESILEHLLTDKPVKPGIDKNATHISLTIDLSKKSSNNT